MTYTDEERLCVARWRGLDEVVLLQLSRLDGQSLLLDDCYFAAERRADIESRARVIAIRKRLGIGPMDKLSRLT